jgi:hypothetical protein
VLKEEQWYKTGRLNSQNVKGSNKINTEKNAIRNAPDFKNNQHDRWLQFISTNERKFSQRLIPLIQQILTMCLRHKDKYDMVCLQDA